MCFGTYTSLLRDQPGQPSTKPECSEARNSEFVAGCGKSGGVLHEFQRVSGLNGSIPWEDIKWFQTGEYGPGSGNGVSERTAAITGVLTRSGLE